MDGGNPNWRGSIHASPAGVIAGARNLQVCNWRTVEDCETAPLLFELDQV